MLRWHLRSDLSGMDRADRKIMNGAREGSRTVAQAIVTDIRGSWSSSSPSDPGGPPAKVSGDLDSTVRASQQDERGRFASAENAVIWSVAAGDPNRRTGTHPDGVNYARILEEDMNRPFMLPAIERAANYFGLMMENAMK